MSEVVKIILSVLATALPLIGVLIEIIRRFFKSDKAKKAFENTVFWLTNIQDLLVDAEKFSDYDGREKKLFVMNKVKAISAKNNIPVDMDKISTIIDNAITVTKLINVATKGN